MKLRVQKNNLKRIQEIIDKFKLSGLADITLDEIIEEAIRNAAEADDLDEVPKQTYRDYQWMVKEVKLSKSAENEVRSVIADRSDVINYVISRKPFINKLKRLYIDASWNNQKLNEVLERYEVLDEGFWYLDNVRPNTAIDSRCFCSDGHKRTLPWFAFEDDSEIRVPYAKCGKCGWSGNIYDFIMEASGESYELVIESLFMGLNLYLSDGVREKRDKKIRENGYISDYYRDKMIKEILLDSEAVNEQLGIYYRNDKMAESESSNIWRNRKIYVVKNSEGQIVGLQGRACIDGKKVESESWKRFVKDDVFLNQIEMSYSNKINTPGFRKADNLYLINECINSGAKEVWLCEGSADADRAWALGVCAVASFGASLSEKQAELIKSIGRDVKVVIAYDNDEAGLKGVIKALNTLDGVRREVAFTAKGTDIGECEQLPTPTNWNMIIANSRYSGSIIDKDDLAKAIETTRKKAKKPYVSVSKEKRSLMEWLHPMYRKFWLKVARANAATLEEETEKLDLMLRQYESKKAHQ